MDLLDGGDSEFFYFFKIQPIEVGKMVIRFGEMLNVEISIYEWNKKLQEVGFEPTKLAQ